MIGVRSVKLWRFEGVLLVKARPSGRDRPRRRTAPGIRSRAGGSVIRWRTGGSLSVTTGRVIRRHVLPPQSELALEREPGVALLRTRQDRLAGAAIEFATPSGCFGAVNPLGVGILAVWSRDVSPLMRLSCCASCCLIAPSPTWRPIGTRSHMRRSPAGVAAAARASRCGSIHRRGGHTSTATRCCRSKPKAPERTPSRCCCSPETDGWSTSSWCASTSRR